MELNRTSSLLHLRLSSCLETVLEVQQTLTDSGLDIDLVVRLTDLKAMLNDMSELNVAEKDVSDMESATNHLLLALKPILDLTGEKLESADVLN